MRAAYVCKCVTCQVYCVTS